MLKIDLHTHSLSSGHALNTVYELAKEASRKKLTILGITDHGSSMEGAPHEGYFWISDKLSNLYGVEILLGSEVNIINKSGEIDLSRKCLEKQKIVIACIHEKTPYKNMSIRDNTLALTNAMNNPHVKIISHPIRPEFKVDIKQLVESACSTKTLLELNDQLFEREQGNESLLEQYYLLISLCKKYGAPIIIGSDAHIASRIGEDRHVLAIQKKLSLTNNMIINNREQDLRFFLKNKSY